jgi:uncharacterized SAM-binding protein YcdF (DUF218 family)
MNTASPKQRFRRWFFRLLTLVIAAFATSLAVVCLGIVRAASQQDLRPAAAIVVFGAAEYAGRPSPVYRARLDHAYELFQRGLAPIIITTGGSGGDPKFSEGGVGRDYLLRRGIPERSLIAETQGSDTAESAERVSVILRANGIRSCLAVSDQYHVFRIKKVMESQGLVVHVAPRPDSRPHASLPRATAVLREALSYMLWQLHLT